jgi:hypothetical protein
MNRRAFVAMIAAAAFAGLGLRGRRRYGLMTPDRSRALGLHPLRITLDGTTVPLSVQSHDLEGWVDVVRIENRQIVVDYEAGRIVVDRRYGRVRHYPHEKTRTAWDSVMRTRSGGFALVDVHQNGA